MIKKYLCFLTLVLFTQTAFALDLTGFAVVRLQSRHLKPLAMEQSITIHDREARFVSIDDFGNVNAIIDFAKNRINIRSAQGVSSRKLKTALSLPLGESEFLDVISYQLPDSFVTVSQTTNEEVWVSRKNKKMKVTFSDFIKAGDVAKYPQRIHIQNGKNYFDLTWKNVSIHSAH